MDLQVEQGCPQCGAQVVLAETDRLLTCSFCGVKNYLQARAPLRYLLTNPSRRRTTEELLFAPYLRFKGTIFLVTHAGISHRVVDTTQAGTEVDGLPPSLGVRPQAMRLQRLTAVIEGAFLRQTVKAAGILDKVATISNLGGRAGHDLCHRAYIGESLSLIYLPLVSRQQAFYDGITDTPLTALDPSSVGVGEKTGFDPAWQVSFRATLCPQCGASLDGSGDCQVMTCANCHTAWAFGADGLERIDWRIMAGDPATRLYLPFWKITAHIPALELYSFADFVVRTNQPFLPRPEWRDRILSIWVPAIRLRPKIFLQAGRQATLGQWLLRPENGRVLRSFHPVTLPAGEARQAVKVILAASTTSPRRIFPYLPRVQLEDVRTQLVFLPFRDKGHDWVQADSGTVIAKNNLHHGRSL